MVGVNLGAVADHARPHRLGGWAAQQINRRGGVVFRASAKRPRRGEAVGQVRQSRALKNAGGYGFGLRQPPAPGRAVVDVARRDPTGQPDADYEVPAPSPRRCGCFIGTWVFVLSRPAINKSAAERFGFGGFYRRPRRIAPLDLVPARPTLATGRRPGCSGFLRINAAGGGFRYRRTAPSRAGIRNRHDLRRQRDRRPGCSESRADARPSIHEMPGRVRLIHRSCSMTARHCSFISYSRLKDILSDGRVVPELSTCVTHGLYRQSKRQSSLV
jgi:hypothetical protein